MASDRNVSGLVLAGGLANRMGYVNKGAQKLGGSTLAELVMKVLKPQVQSIFISANSYSDYFEQFNYPVYKDIRQGFLGPLAGIETVLTKEPSIEWLFCTPVDTPFIPADLVIQLFRVIDESEDCLCAVPTHNGLRHPLHCLIHASLLPSLTEFLDSGERSVGFWLRKCGMKEVSISAEPRSFLNINTHSDLENAK